MFDGAYQPEPQPEPAAIPRIPQHGRVWLVAALLGAAICVAGTLGSLAAGCVMR